MESIQISTINIDDRPWVVQTLKAYWGATEVITQGQIHEADKLPGFIALMSEVRVGLLTYHIRENQCEIVSLNSLDEGKSIGSTLIDAVTKKALSNGCTRLWLITTNDNLPALGFYQKRGFQIVAIHRGAVEQSRKIKPEIPSFGYDGIPIRDEVELEIRF